VSTFQPQPGGAPVIERLSEHDPVTGEPIMAHIVKTDPGTNAAAVVLEARIYGIEVEALCGHRWVPQRAPKQYPVCGKCKEIYDLYRGFNGHLNETPGEA
jgi:hypothetical protein